MTKYNSPKIAVTINQENGEFIVIGNRTGLEHLNSKLSELIETDLAHSESASFKLDNSITKDLSQVIMGEVAVDEALEMIRFYNTSKNQFDSAPENRFVNLKLAVKVFWFWVLPIVGVLAVIYYATNA